jgi:NAD(P)-dependent dehydrogenase (short-subunit alcohol dehydrogenase family)
MSLTIDFSGQIALITGGGKGVGRGITERFLSAGAEVVICGRSAPDELPEVGGRTARFVATDVRDLEQQQGLVSQIVADHGRLDILINNAGGAPEAAAATASPRFHEKIVHLNLLAPMHLSQMVNQVMQEQADGGSIVSITSVSGHRPSPGTAAYGAAKAGLISWTQSTAVEWAPKVRVNTVSAGMVLTEQAAQHFGTGDLLRRVEDTVPLGRLAAPVEIGQACVYLASPMASYVTGTDLLIHGGGEWPSFFTVTHDEQEN